MSDCCDLTLLRSVKACISGPLAGIVDHMTPNRNVVDMPSHSKLTARSWHTFCPNQGVQLDARPQRVWQQRLFNSGDVEHNQSNRGHGNLFDVLV